MIMKKRMILLMLLMLSMMLAACNTNTAAPEAPTQPPAGDEEDALRNVYTMTIGEGLVGQGITKRDIQMASAVTQQDTEGLELNATENMIYINADQADLDALAGSTFFEDAINRSVPAIIESESTEKLNMLLEQQFGFEFPGATAVLLSKTEGGTFSVAPIDESNVMEDILDIALGQSNKFQHESPGPDDAATPNTETIETQQNSSENWIEGPNPVENWRSNKRTENIWEGTGTNCPKRTGNVDEGDPCESSVTDEITTSKTWAVTIGRSMEIPLGEAFSLTVDNSFTKGRTEEVSKTLNRTVRIKPGFTAYPVIKQDTRSKNGWFTGKRRVTEKCAGPGSAPDCGKVETITKNSKNKQNYRFNVDFPVSPSWSTWDIRKN